MKLSGGLLDKLTLSDDVFNALTAAIRLLEQPVMSKSEIKEIVKNEFNKLDLDGVLNEDEISGYIAHALSGRVPQQPVMGEEILDLLREADSKLSYIINRCGIKWQNMRVLEKGEVEKLIGKIRSAYEKALSGRVPAKEDKKHCTCYGRRSKDGGIVGEVSSTCPIHGKSEKEPKEAEKDLCETCKHNNTHHCHECYDKASYEPKAENELPEGFYANPNDLSFDVKRQIISIMDTIDNILRYLRGKV